MALRVKMDRLLLLLLPVLIEGKDARLLLHELDIVVGIDVLGAGDLVDVGVDVLLGIPDGFCVIWIGKERIDELVVGIGESRVVSGEEGGGGHDGTADRKREKLRLCTMHIYYYSIDL